MYHRCEFSLTLPPENNSTESGKLIDVSPSPVTVWHVYFEMRDKINNESIDECLMSKIMTVSIIVYFLDHCLYEMG